MCDRFELMAELSSELLRRRRLDVNVERSTYALCRTQAAARARVRVNLIRTLTLTLTLTLALSMTLPLPLPLNVPLPLTRRMLGHLKLYLQHFNPANAPQVGVRDRVRVRVRVCEQVGFGFGLGSGSRWGLGFGLGSGRSNLTLYPGGGRPAGRRLRAGAGFRDAQQA